MQSIINYWSPTNIESLPNEILLNSKLDTDLYELVKRKLIPLALEFSLNGRLFALMMVKGKIIKIFDEHLDVYKQLHERLQIRQQENEEKKSNMNILNNVEYSRRLTIEKDLEKNSSIYSLINLRFDSSRTCLFLFNFIYNRSEYDNDCDVYNEKPTREEILAATGDQALSSLSQSAIIHTTCGDIHVRLFPEYVQKPCENFIRHSKQSYYNGCIFHCVIKQSMIQTGGQSIWRKKFQDEFHPQLKHDRLYTLSMVNAGPNTNGSQFFITVVTSPWLDNKHSIFGRVSK
ncbi:unnamed protein product [Rotaria socialis]|uniref:Peptidyl-prolyl cis-trans isomerase n=2 Tax=Rotaria socialis TaxID=392032 RepID=A0A818R9G0_9BILA|nr:unnamed protein product [Rotaria socialis]CAF4225813.1 unnamed protein product [Rotaria socialis]